MSGQFKPRRVQLHLELLIGTGSDTARDRRSRRGWAPGPQARERLESGHYQRAGWRGTVEANKKAPWQDAARGRVSRRRPSPGPPAERGDSAAECRAKSHQNVGL
jgi:hypothetical protein